MSRKLIISCIIVINLLFLIYYGGLSYFMRPHYDDLHTLWRIQETSIWDIISEDYLGQTGRIAWVVFNTTICKLSFFCGLYNYMPLILILSGMLICCYVAVDCLPNVNRIYLCSAVILMYNVYVLTNIDFATAFWMSGMGYYLKFPTILLLFNLINKNKLNAIHWIIYCVLVFFIGFGNEAVTPVVLCFMAINIFVLMRKNKIKMLDVFKDKITRRISITLFIVFIGWILVVVAPGNFARMSTSNELQQPHSIIEMIKAFAESLIMFFYMIAFYIHYYIILGLVFMIMGNEYGRKHNRHFSPCNIKSIKYISFGYLIYVVLTILPLAYICGGFVIQRTYTHLVLCTILFICSLFFILGMYLRNITHLFKITLSIGLFWLIGVCLYNINLDIPIVKKNSEVFDKRIEYCHQQNAAGAEGIVEVEELPSVSTIDTKYWILTKIGKPTPKQRLSYVSDTDKEPNEYSMHLRRAYHWNFDICLKKDE